MAGEFLRSHGIDIDAEMARIQSATAHDTDSSRPSLVIDNVSLPGRSETHKWTVSVKDGRVNSIAQYDDKLSVGDTIIDGHGALLAPSLCHPHIHLDKAYLLSHPRYAHLQVEQGDFQEAMKLTGEAKSKFEHQDLLERGQRVIDESVAAGVTHIRAFVELDAGVGRKCLEAGLALKRRAESEKKCVVQLCAFAQLPLFSPSQDDEEGELIRELMQSAAESGDVDVIGSTPYVEKDRQKMKSNVQWTIDLSIQNNLHLDFHLDYNLDPQQEPLIWFVIQALKRAKWKQFTRERTIVLGHCTRLVLFDDATWHRLFNEIEGEELPIYFVGLPSSDLFMMGTGKHPEIRGTLNVPRLIKEYDLNACIGVNNIGNAFTPQGSCDPLSLACSGIGIYKAGTKKDAELLFSCVSTQAKAAIGFGRSGKNPDNLHIDTKDVADFVLFGTEKPSWRTRSSISSAVYLYDNCAGRRTILNGCVASARLDHAHDK